MPEDPDPIDRRATRFDQAVVAVALLTGFAFRIEQVVPAVAIVMAIGAALGPRLAPLVVLFDQALAPRLGPVAHTEPAGPWRFSVMLEAAVLALATVLVLAGVAVLAWPLALVVAIAAVLDAMAGICLGCEAYRHLR